MDTFFFKIFFIPLLPHVTYITHIDNTLEALERPSFVQKFEYIATDTTCPLLTNQKFMPQGSQHQT
jgi:hypothetical protein